MKPTIGRIVHYTDWDLRVLAGIVTTARDNGNVSLHVFYPTEQINLPSVEYTEAAAGTEEARERWSWPSLIHTKEFTMWRDVPTGPAAEPAAPKHVEPETVEAIPTTNLDTAPEAPVAPSVDAFGRPITHREG